MYKFIAEMRDGRIITLCEWDKIELFDTLIKQFDESDNILRFAIEENNVVIREKILKPKERRDSNGKSKVLVHRKP